MNVKCVEVWGDTYRSYLQSLFKSKRRAIRIVCKSSYLCHSARLLRKLEVLPLFYLINYKTVIFMYNVFYYIFPTNISSSFTHISIVYLPEQHRNVYVHCTTARHEQMCVEHTGANIWNSIEIHTENRRDLKLFRVKFRKSL